MQKHIKSLSVSLLAIMLLAACVPPNSSEVIETTDGAEVSTDTTLSVNTVSYPVSEITDTLGHKLFIMDNRCLLDLRDLLTPDLLDEQVRVYSYAEAVWRFLNVNSDLLESGANMNTSEKIERKLADGSNQTYYASAYSYSSFVNFLRSVFANEYVDELLSEPNAAFAASDVSGDDRLFLSKNKREEKKLATRRKLEVIDSNDKTVHIKITATYYTNDAESETHDETFSEMIVNSPDGWRMDGFKGWI